MFKNVTAGQFYPAESGIHSLDARVKLVGVILFFVSLFFINKPFFLVVPVLFLFSVALSSCVPVKYVVKPVLTIRYLLILSFAIRLFTDYSNCGFSSAFMLLIKLIMAVLCTSLFMLTTTVSQITDSMEWLLSPLKVFKVPVGDIAVVFSVAVRFIPVLSQEGIRIAEAQRARGSLNSRKTLISRIKGIIPLAVSVFACAVRRSEELADALSARGYGINESRTRLHPLMLKKTDSVGIVSIVLYVALVISGVVYVA